MLERGFEGNQFVVVSHLLSEVLFFGTDNCFHARTMLSNGSNGFGGTHVQMPMDVNIQATTAEPPQALTEPLQTIVSTKTNTRSHESKETRQKLSPLFFH